MSSHRLSASGDRQYSITAGGGQFTAMQVPSKPGDGATLQFNFPEIAALVPQGAVIERVKTERGYELFVLRIQGPVYNEGKSRNLASLTLHGFVGELESGSWPHTNLDVRKAAEGDPLASALGSNVEVLDTIELVSPPTE